MNHKQLGYGQDDSLSYSTFRRFTNLWGILRVLFSLESQGKDDLHWISYALRAIGRDQYPGSLLHNVRMRKRVRWFFSQCCLSYATQPHRRTDIIRRNKFDYTRTNSEKCGKYSLQLKTCVNSQISSTNVFYVVVCLFSNRSQMTSKCSKYKKCHTRRSQVCHWCAHHLFTSSVI